MMTAVANLRCFRSSRSPEAEDQGSDNFRVCRLSLRASGAAFAKRKATRIESAIQEAERGRRLIARRHAMFRQEE